MYINAMPAQRNRHQNAKAPRLPSALVSEMETELGKPGNRSRKRKSRKEERKEKRMAKKQKVHHHFSRKNNATEGKVKLASLPKSSKQNGPTSGNTTTVSIKKSVTNNDVSGTDKQRLEKLAKNNPNFYQMLVEDQLVNPADSVSSSRSDQDDMDIRRYEKKLGLKRKAKKSTKKLSSGIGELLSTLESDFGLENDESSDEQTLGCSAEESDIDGLACISDHESSSQASNDDYGQNFTEQFERFSKSDDSDGGEDSDDSDDSQDSEQSGELDSKGVGNDTSQIRQIPPPAPYKPEDNGGTSKYVPPHLRKKLLDREAEKNESYIRLQRQVKGCINRLSENNLESILQEIQNCYLRFPRADVTSVMTNIIIAVVSDKAHLLDSFVSVHVAVVTCISQSIGVEVAAHFLQDAVTRFEKQYREYEEMKVANDLASEAVETSSKQCVNLITVIALMYSLKVVGCNLVYDLIRMFISSLSEIDVELLLKLIKVSGPQLRSDDPLALKDIIESVRSNITKIPNPTPRQKFMLEQVYNLKNNKFKSGFFTSPLSESLKKFISNHSKRQASVCETLRCSLDDIRNIETKGKWWIVGNAWVGNQFNSPSDHPKKSNEPMINDDAMNNLLKLAKQQNMNTDVRRSVFMVLMTSEDYADAYDRLLKLNLKDKQEREIVRVILHCCSNEKIYNPYYALLSSQLCSHSTSFKITYQFALWDILTELSNPASTRYSLRQLSHISKLYQHLILTFSLNLTIFRTASFATPTANTKLFLQLIFTGILLGAENEKELRKIFGKSSGLGKKFDTVKDGVRLFLNMWLAKNNEVVKDNQREGLAKRIKIAKDVLSEDLFL